MCTGWQVKGKRVDEWSLMRKSPEQEFILIEPDILFAIFCSNLCTGDSPVWTTSMYSFAFCFLDWFRWWGLEEEYFFVCPTSRRAGWVPKSWAFIKTFLGFVYTILPALPFKPQPLQRFYTTAWFLVSLQSKQTLVYCPFIKLFSNYPTWKLCFPRPCFILYRLIYTTKSNMSVHVLMTNPMC